MQALSGKCTAPAARKHLLHDGVAPVGAQTVSLACLHHLEPHVIFWPEVKVQGHDLLLLLPIGLLMRAVAWCVHTASGGAAGAAPGCAAEAARCSSPKSRAADLHTVRSRSGAPRPAAGCSARAGSPSVVCRWGGAGRELQSCRPPWAVSLLSAGVEQRPCLLVSAIVARTLRRAQRPGGGSWYAASGHLPEPRSRRPPAAQLPRPQPRDAAWCFRDVAPAVVSGMYRRRTPPGTTAGA